MYKIFDSLGLFFKERGLFFKERGVVFGFFFESIFVKEVVFFSFFVGFYYSIISSILFRGIVEEVVF